MKFKIYGLFSLILIILVSGCSMTMEYGNWPNVDNLSLLRLGESTSSEITSALGEPTGYGKGYMPDFPGTATVWSYEYQKISGNEADVSILLVFLRDGVYQGHFWFDAKDTAVVNQE